MPRAALFKVVVYFTHFSFQFGYFDSFFRANGSRVLIIFDQIDNTDTKEKKSSHKLLLTSGDEMPLFGTCIYFVKLNDEKPLDDNKAMDRVSTF